MTFQNLVTDYTVSVHSDGKTMNYTFLVLRKVGYVLNKQMSSRNIFESNKGYIMDLSKSGGVFLWFLMVLLCFWFFLKCPFSLKVSHLDNSEFFQVMCSNSCMPLG